MKITLTLSQLKKILNSEPINLPITLKAQKFTDKELDELARLIQSKQRKK